ncbi:MAG: HAMP domain-containing histidine kinase [Armatimonadetes bacterium]|nr:HAMP domain-containing histidine kinase [Armatimonadota bacterium]
MKSFRGQVTAWIAAVVALSLTALGGTMTAVNLSRMRSDLDRGLRDRAEAFSRGPRGPRFGIGGPGGPPMLSDGQPGPGPALRQQGPFPGDDSDLIAAIRRPRVLENPTEGPPPQGADFFDPPAIDAARQGRAGYSDRLYRKTPVRVFTMPFLGQDGVRRIVQTAQETTFIEDAATVQVRTMVTVIPLAVVAALGVAYFLTGRVVRPIADMEATVGAIAEGELSARLPTQGLDEFARLGGRFNTMAERVESSVNGLQASLEQQKRFTADASHELRTPLTRLQLATSAGLDAPPEEARDALKVADEAARDMSRLVRQLLELAQADAGTLARPTGTVDLRVIASDAVAKLPPGGPEVLVDLAERAVGVNGDADRLERAVLNLLENARRHTPSDGTVTVTVKVASDGRALLSVVDTGEGIAPEHLPRLTDRFYRVDAARDRDAGGSGLGLAIVHEIVKAHDGLLAIESGPGRGTTVTLSLPLPAP